MVVQSPLSVRYFFSLTIFTCFPQLLSNSILNQEIGGYLGHSITQSGHNFFYISMNELIICGYTSCLFQSDGTPWLAFDLFHVRDLKRMEERQTQNLSLNNSRFAIMFYSLNVISTVKCIKATYKNVKENRNVARTPHRLVSTTDH